MSARTSPEQLEHLIREIERVHLERIEALEDGWAALKRCDECHHLFSNQDDYAQHLCAGSQGR